MCSEYHTCEFQAIL